VMSAVMSAVTSVVESAVTSTVMSAVMSAVMYAVMSAEMSTSTQNTRVGTPEWHFSALVIFFYCMYKMQSEQKLSNASIVNYNFSHFDAIISPCVFCAELEHNKYYICITRNFNETMDKWKAGFGPHWVRQHRLKRIIEMEHEVEHVLQQMAVYYMVLKGCDNVRSSIPGHSNVDLTNEPEFFLQFKNLAGVG
jgi:hypothetical protein